MVDLAYNPAARDDSGLTVLERFDQIANFFLAACKASGSPHPQGQLYDRKNWTPWGYYSEKDLVDYWAKKLDVPLRHILQGITSGFGHARDNAAPVTSFRYLMPHITQRARKGTPL